MSAHLSPLALDSLAAGATIDAAAFDHVAACAQCAAALDERKAFSARVLAEPEARRRLGVLQSKVVAAASAPARPWWFKVLVFAVPVMLVAVVVNFASTGEVALGSRVKGAAQLQVLRDGVAVSSVPAGSRVELRLGGAGAKYGAVLAIDDKTGAVDIVWPPNGEQSKRLEGGASERLAEFQVTEGSMTLRAYLGDGPERLEGLVRDAGVPSASLHLEVTP